MKQISLLAPSRTQLSALFLAILITAGCKSSAAPTPSPAPDPQASTTSGRPSLQNLPVPDPAFNMNSGTLPFFAGWTGTAAIDRTDPFCSQCPDIVLRMTSPDGKSLIQQLNHPFHTVLLPPMARADGHIAVMRFTSTADLLTRFILPALNLGGRPSTPQPFAPAFLDTMRQQAAASGIPGTISDTAGVLVSGIDPGEEYFVYGITRGTLQGTQGENSKTNVSIVEAPIGHAQALAEALKALPPIQSDVQWASRQQQLLQEQAAGYQHQQQVGNAAVQQSIANLNASTARTAADSNATRAAVDQHGQAARSAARYNSGVQTGNGSSAQWCNSATNQQRTMYNTLNPPDNSGNWVHCD
jgi:hypothetical protein